MERLQISDNISVFFGRHQELLQRRLADEPRTKNVLQKRAFRRKAKQLPTFSFLASQSKVSNQTRVRSTMRCDLLPANFSFRFSSTGTVNVGSSPTKRASDSLYIHAARCSDHVSLSEREKKWSCGKYHALQARNGGEKCTFKPRCRRKDVHYFSPV